MDAVPAWLRSSTTDSTVALSGIFQVAPEARVTFVGSMAPFRRSAAGQLQGCTALSNDIRGDGTVVSASACLRSGLTAFWVSVVLLTVSVPLPDFSTLPLPVRGLPAGVHRLHGWSGYHSHRLPGKGKYGAVIQRGGAGQCAAPGR